MAEPIPNPEPEHPDLRTLQILAEVRRSRRIAVGFGILAFAATIVAIVSLVTQTEIRGELEQARRLARASERQTAAQAKPPAVIPRPETPLSETKQLPDADLEALRAEAGRAAQERDELRQKASDEEKLLAQARLEAQRQADLARLNESEAEKQAELARANAAEAKRQVVLAMENARQTQAQSHPADAAQKSAVDRLNARELVNDAVGQIASGQPSRALGEIARALTLDPDSLAARSLAFDQLLRSPAAHLAKSGIELFVHPALTQQARVLFAVFSPDGRQIATASDDGIVRIWDAASARILAELTGHAAPLNTIAFSPDGRRILGASFDQTAPVWDIASRKQVLVLRCGARVTSACFSPDGRRILTASQDRTAQIWDAETGARSGPALVHPMTVNSASFSPDGQSVVTSCADARARIWNLSGAVTRELSHQGEVRSAVFSPDGRLVVTASSDATARIWAVSTGIPQGDILQHTRTVYHATFSPDGKRIATASGDQSARIWETSTGRPVTAALPHNGTVLSAAFSPDGTRLVTASGNAGSLWEVFYKFDDTAELVKLLEGVSGFGASENTPTLAPGDAARILDEVKAGTNGQSGSTASFIRWFLAHR